jgi:hypothetical protein
MALTLPRYIKICASGKNKSVGGHVHKMKKATIAAKRR